MASPKPLQFGLACYKPRPYGAESTLQVASAVASLTALGAFDAQEQLTALGRQLCRMPMDPRVGKACIFACLLRWVLVLPLWRGPLQCLHVVHAVKVAGLHVTLHLGTSGLQCSLLGRLSGLPGYYLCVCCGLLKKLLLLDCAGETHGGQWLTLRHGRM